MIPSLLNLANRKLAPRGERIAHNTSDAQRKRTEHAFKEARKFRLTASLLPTWLGFPSSFSRKKVIRNMNAHSGVFERPTSDFGQWLLDYGRRHEERALQGYHELTRFLIGLGSLRFADDDAVLLPKGETSRHVKVENDVHWDSILSATPDGFVADASDEHSQTFGLLEIKCPAHENGRHKVDVMPDQFIKGDDKMIALFLQVWEQLEVVQQAQYCDLVIYKKMDPRVSNDEYLWIARLYRDEAKMREIKQLLEPHFQNFAEAVEAMKEDAELTETEQEGLDRAEIAKTQKELKVRDGRGGEFLPESQKRCRGKSDIQRALEDWYTSSLYFRDAGNGDFPWKTDEQLNILGFDSTERLIRRYHVQTGECARFYQGTHSPATFGGRAVTADQLWTREYMA